MRSPVTLECHADGELWIVIGGTDLEMKSKAFVWAQVMLDPLPLSSSVEVLDELSVQGPGNERVRVNGSVNSPLAPHRNENLADSHDVCGRPKHAAIALNGSKNSVIRFASRRRNSSTPK